MIAKKREQDLVVEVVDGATLVYDLTNGQAHSLDDAAAAVWQASDGRRGVASIAAKTGFEPAAVIATLDRLDALGLLQGSDDGATRRTAFRRAALVGAGAAAMALPQIKSLAAPTAAQAATVGAPGALCNTGTECASGICNSNVCV